MSEQDPYQTPDSQRATKPPTSNDLVWKVFFWITATLMCLSTIGVSIMQNLTLFDYVDFLLSLIGTAGLWGFAYYKPVGKLVFWRYYFYVVLIESFVVTFLFPLLNIPVYGEITEFNSMFIVGCIYMAAILYAIYQYAYRRPFIWHGAA